MHYLQIYISACCFVAMGWPSVLIWFPKLTAGIWLFMTRQLRHLLHRHVPGLSVLSVPWATDWSQGWHTRSLGYPLPQYNMLLVQLMSRAQGCEGCGGNMIRMADIVHEIYTRHPHAVLAAVLLAVL